MSHFTTTCYLKFNSLKSKYRKTFLTLCILVLSIIGVYSYSLYHQYFKPHYTNIDGSVMKKKFSDMLAWRLERFTKSPPEFFEPIPQSQKIPINPLVLKQSNYEGITWIGHATTLVQHQNVHVLTDPIFSERASPVSFIGPKRFIKATPSLEQLPRIDIVFLSHNHYDHSDLPSIKRLMTKFPNIDWVVPVGIDEWLVNEGANPKMVHGLKWWQSIKVKGVKATLVPAYHWSAREIFDRNETLWGGLVIEWLDHFKFYHAGDTGYHQTLFKEIGKRFKTINWAALPIGAYEPHWFMKYQHVNPQESVQVMKDINAQHALGIHWGTFNLTNESSQQPVRDLQNILKNNVINSSLDFRIIGVGQSISFTTLK